MNQFIAVWIDSIYKISYFKFRGNQRTLDTLAQSWAYKYVPLAPFDQLNEFISLPNSYIYIYIYLSLSCIYTYKNTYLHSLSPEGKKYKVTEAADKLESEKNRGEKRSRRRKKINREDLHQRSSPEFSTTIRVTMSVQTHILLIYDAYIRM